MQQSLKQIQKFITSTQCLFKFDIIDYPNNWQQQLIINYFNMRKILQKPHNLIIRQLHSFSQNSLEQISLGFLYLLLLDKGNQERLLPYMMVLKVETWGYLAQNFQILLDYGDIVKSNYLGNSVIVLNQLLSYGMCNPNIICSVVNLLSYYDTSQETLAFTKIILDYFLKKLAETTPLPKEINITLCHYLLPKIMKNPHHLFQDVSMKIVEKLWQDYSQYCLQARISIISNIQLSPYDLRLSTMIPFYRTLKEAKDNGFKDDLLREKIQFSLLPKRTQAVLQFLIKQTTMSVSEMKHQLLWLEKSWRTNKLNQSDLTLDISKWIIQNGSFMQRKIYILQWLTRKSLNIHQQIFQKMKQTLFYNWFLPTFNMDSIMVSVLMLRHFLATDTRFSVEMLSYLFSFLPNEEQRLRHIFQQTNKLNYVKIENILNNKLIPQGIQATFYDLIQQPKTQISKALKFNPDTIQNPIKPTSQPNYRQQVNYFTSKNQKSSEILFQQQFISEFDLELKNMLDEPNIENFIQFFKRLIKIISQTRAQNKQLSHRYAQEGAKVIYLCYNCEFQDIKNMIEPQKSVINHMISILLKQWHQVTQKVQSIKMIIKKLCEIFPMAEVAFWYYFLMQFDFGGANNRDFKNWLIPKEKNEYVIKAVEIIQGRVNNQLRNKAAKYLIR